MKKNENQKYSFGQKVKMDETIENSHFPHGKQD